ncbi:MAG: transporter, partial [Gemmataceae bacterium]|nr:transporter [Gemmataceae bacterium]
MPRSTLRLRFDYDLRNRRPTRAEYLFPGDGFRVPETRVDLQELDMYVEYSLNEWFSTFMATPYRWVNPESNRNVTGVGDLRFGSKFAGYNSETFLTTFQLTFVANTAQRALTGTGHWSVEPALLVNWRLFNAFTLEGQAGYWVPLGGTPFAGEVFKYGAALSYGGKTGGAIGLMPVVEVVGWTMTSGREIWSPAPGIFVKEGAAGDTVINGCLGLRFTLGESGEIYTG